MKKIAKLASISLVTLVLAACGGGGSDGNNRGNNTGAGNIVGKTSTPVASRTGKANYVGTFTATVKPTSTLGSNGKIYKGGKFDGRVTAEADFDKDEIDLELKGNRKAGVAHRYNADFDDARISGRKFSGKGTHDLQTVPKGIRIKNSNVKLDGSFNADGSRISGKTTSDKQSSIRVDSEFSASEK